MKTKLVLLMAIAGASAFAQTRFSVQIGGGYGPGYYAPPPQAYYRSVRPYAYRSYGYESYGPAWGGGAGYWGVDPDRAHRREEWRGLRNHHEAERYMYGDSPELREHQAQERHQLRHEQWHERNGDYDAGDGPAHGSARDGMPYAHNH